MLTPIFPLLASYASAAPALMLLLLYRITKWASRRRSGGNTSDIPRPHSFNWGFWNCLQKLYLSNVMSTTKMTLDAPKINATFEGKFGTFYNYEVWTYLTTVVVHIWAFPCVITFSFCVLIISWAFTCLMTLIVFMSRHVEVLSFIRPLPNCYPQRKPYKKLKELLCPSLPDTDDSDAFRECFVLPSGPSSNNRLDLNVSSRA